MFPEQDNSTDKLQEAPSAVNAEPPPWSSSPASSAEYSSYKGQIQKAAPFESVAEKINPYTGFKIKTQEDYQLYCNFLLQQKTNEAQLSKAYSKIAELEAEISLLRQQAASQEPPQPSEEPHQTNRPIPKPIIAASISQSPVQSPMHDTLSRRKTTRKSNHKSGFFRLYIFAILLFFLTFYFVVQIHESKPADEKVSAGEEASLRAEYVYIDPESDFNLYHTDTSCQLLGPGYIFVPKSDVEDDYRYCYNCQVLASGSETSASSSSGYSSYDSTPSTGTSYIGNSSTKIFHHSNCSYLPSVENQVAFPTRTAAILEDFTPCAHCNP